MADDHIEEAQANLASQLLDADLIEDLIPIDWTQLSLTSENTRLPLLDVMQAHGVILQKKIFTNEEIQAKFPDHYADLEKLKAFFQTHGISQTAFLDDCRLGSDDIFVSYFQQYDIQLSKFKLRFIESEDANNDKITYCIRECQYFNNTIHFSKLILIDRLQDTRFIPVCFLASGTLFFLLTNPEPISSLIKNPTVEEPRTDLQRFEASMRFLKTVPEPSAQKIYQMLHYIVKWASHINYDLYNNVAKLAINKPDEYLESLYQRVLFEIEQLYTIFNKKLPLGTAAVIILLAIAFGLSLFFSPFSISLGALAIGALGLTTCIIISACTILAASYAAYKIWDTNRFLVPLHDELQVYKKSLITPLKNPQPPILNKPTKTRVELPPKSCLKNTSSESESDSYCRKIVRYSKTATVGISFDTHYRHADTSGDTIFTQKKLF